MSSAGEGLAGGWGGCCLGRSLGRSGRTMADEDIDIAAIAARFLAQAPPLQFPPVLDGTRRTGSAVSSHTHSALS